MFDYPTIQLITSYLQAHPWGCAMVCILSIAFLHQVYFYLRYIRKGAKKSTTSHIPEETKNLPGVSVVVCAHNEEINLKSYLHTLLNQDYPTFEVIVVDDESEDNTYTILEQYRQQSNRLYHTFVPRGARVISSKKLALSIGIKAAKYNYILLTDADCRPESRYWIREMMGGFQNEKTEIVLGFSPYFETKGLLNHIICYDTLFSGLQYMGMARCGHPYMGVGRNLAYRKETFFSNHGFQGLLNERAGDDDLLVNKIANRSNTSVVCNPNALTWSSPKRTWYEWIHQKRRHLSVSPRYSTQSKIRLIFEPITRGLVHFLSILCIAYGLITGQWIIAASAYGLWSLRLLVQLIIINIAARRLRMREIGIELVLFDIFLPLITLFIFTTQPLFRKKQQFYW